jgi:GTP cyclohydrolase II
MHVPPRVIRPHVSCVASSPLPTKHGLFSTFVFLERGPQGIREGRIGEGHDFEKEHVALVFGDVAGQANVPVRVHSECMTGEVFGSLKCDCKGQLDAAMAEVALRGAGAILYLRQEGRGIGLANKIRAYDLQSQGHDTVDANRMLGLPDDAREYDVAAKMLAHLDIKSVLLMTNNPEKISALRALGVVVNGRLPLVIAPNPFSAGYLEAKRLRMAHDLPSRPLLRIASGDAE